MITSGLVTRLTTMQNKGSALSLSLLGLRMSDSKMVFFFFPFRYCNEMPEAVKEALQIKGFPWEHEDLGLISSTHLEKNRHDGTCLYSQYWGGRDRSLGLVG